MQIITNTNDTNGHKLSHVLKIVLSYNHFSFHVSYYVENVLSDTNKNISDETVLDATGHPPPNIEILAISIVWRVFKWCHIKACILTL